MSLIERLLGAGTAIGVDWAALKVAVEHSIGFSHDALHVLLGVLVQLAVARAFRSSVASAKPYLVVLALELLNEANDFRVELWPHLGMQLGEGIKDLVLTMLLPTVLLIAARRSPHLLGAPPRQLATTQAVAP
jgi:xanthosine utilization system XapX-like protein